MVDATEPNGSDVMPIFSVIVLAGIVCAFAFFAAVLMWGEYQTRHIGRKGPPEAETTAQIYSLNQAAKDSRIKEPVRHSEPAKLDRTIRQIG